MIFLDRLSVLHKHQLFLTQTLQSSAVFLVGGAIRDLLLGITNDPQDIDVTCPGTPDDLAGSITYPEDTISTFSTEKFGTVTLIPKHWENAWTTYEITPFREESGYADNRRPDEIQRSSDLRADSKRRDFRINCLYWTNTHFNGTIRADHVNNPDRLLSLLKSQGRVFDREAHCLIIRDQAVITTCFANGSMNTEAVHSTIVDAPQIGITHDELTFRDTGISILIDPQCWLNDLLSKTIQTVGNPTDRFAEDALRIVRGARQAIVLNAKIPPVENEQNTTFIFKKTTRLAMVAQAPLVYSLSFERLHQEIMKVFDSSNPFGFISLLKDLWLLYHIFPALADTLGNEQPTLHHPFDTFNHTLLTVYHLQQRNDDPLVKLAMLYHDVGKPEQYAFMDKAIAENPDNPDRSGYEAHPEISVRLMKRDFKRLCLPKKHIDTIARYIAYHHRPGEILDAKPENRIKKLRALLSEWWIDQCNNLFDIVIADRLGQYNPLQPAAIEAVLTLKETLSTLHDQEGRFTKATLAINGTDLMEQFDLAPGPRIGKLLDDAFNRVLNDIKERNTKELILEYVKGLIGT